MECNPSLEIKMSPRLLHFSTGFVSVLTRCFIFLCHLAKVKTISQPLSQKEAQRQQDRTPKCGMRLGAFVAVTQEAGKC